MENQVNHTAITTSILPNSSLQCPKCGCGEFTDNTTSLDCAQCYQSYPQLKFGNISIPFVFADVNAAVHAWFARINGFNQSIDEDIRQINTQLKDKRLSKLTRDRLKRFSTLKKQYHRQIADHLDCFSQFTLDQYAYSNNEVAKNQGIDSYIDNIFRDWCWDNGENEALLESVSGLVQEEYHAGDVLALGAGASRFPYDFHTRYDAKHSVLLDINPVLLGCAAKIIHGQTVTLNEFPVAPLTMQDSAVVQECKFDSVNKHQFSFLLSDALNAPLKEKSFDTILTPWFIDIIPMDFREFIPHVNRLLKSGGTWINTGSLAFLHSNQHWNYSEEEVVDLLKKYGFDEVKTSRSKVDYLNSPHSAHGRIEDIFSFSATKKFDCRPKKEFNYLPEWINDHEMSIPAEAELIAASSTHLLQAQVLSAIDGERSIIEIARLLARQYEMTEQSALAAVRQILIDNS